jgi:hypothetical protein
MRPTSSEAKKASGPKRNAPRDVLLLSLYIEAPKINTRKTAKPLKVARVRALRIRPEAVIWRCPPLH